MLTAEFSSPFTFKRPGEKQLTLGSCWALAQAAISIIASAKRLMQEQLGWEEERAHRYLQKRAMDQCCTKYEAARYIIQKLKNGGRL